jgi:hypothetical protein
MFINHMPINVTYEDFLPGVLVILYVRILLWFLQQNVIIGVTHTHTMLVTIINTACCIYSKCII